MENSVKDHGSKLDLNVIDGKKLKNAETCNKFLSGRCTWGEDCDYLHPLEEKDGKDYFLKTRGITTGIFNANQNSGLVVKVVKNQNSLCRAYNQYDCAGGSRKSCGKIHEKMPSDVCYFIWKSYGCKKESCRMLHNWNVKDVPQLSKIVYVQDRNGRTKSVKKVLCRDFTLRGSCPRGKDCSYVHED